MKLDVCKYNTVILNKTVIVFTSLLLMSAASAASDNDVIKTLVNRITQSKTQLLKIEQDISKQNSQQAQKLGQQQHTIEVLREKASGLQRLADERLLSLEKLQQRVKQWSSQSQYQHQLVARYAATSDWQTPNTNLVEDNNISVVDLAYRDLLSKLSPSWQTKNIVTTGGAIKATDVIKLGPIEVALNNKEHIAGPVTREIADEPRLQQGIYNETTLQQLLSLKDTHRGAITFDPTLGNANKLLNQDKSILSHVETGGIWAIPILIFAALSLIVSLLKAVQLICLPRIRPLMAEKIAALTISKSLSLTERQQHIAESLQHTKGAQRKLLQIALDTPISQQRDDYLVAYLLEYKHRIEKYLGAIATSATIAPLLGLLGTVSGMITTFQMMKIFGTGDASTVSGGISEALVTTELGLIVAIPSLIVSALLSRKIKSYHAQLESMAIKLSRIDFSVGIK